MKKFNSKSFLKDKSIRETLFFYLVPRWLVISQHFFEFFILGEISKNTPRTGTLVQAVEKTTKQNDLIPKDS